MQPDSSSRSGCCSSSRSRSCPLSNADINGDRTEFDERRVDPLCSTFLHIMGDEVDWQEIKALFAGSGKLWNGAAFFPTKANNGGPIDNPTARLRLAELEAKVREDRTVLNEGHFFDSIGRRIEIEPTTDA